jgi:acetyltransferase
MERFAIRPYPQDLEEHTQFLGRGMILRPIRPEDEPQHARFLAAIDPNDLRLRFFRVVRAFAHSELARMTQIDYDREMAFIAVRRTDAQEDETVGVVRAVSDPDGTRAEFAILVRSDMKGLGIGAMLMDKLIRYCRTRGIAELVGDVLTENRRMIAIARDFGFAISPNDDGDTAGMTLQLGATPMTAPPAGSDQSISRAAQFGG